MNIFSFSKFFIIAAVFAVVFVTPSTLFPFIVGKYVWFRTTIDLALIFFLSGLLFSNDGPAYLERVKRIFRSPLAIAVTVFVGVFLLACVFSLNPSFSFWSNFERGEGGLQILHLYLFFLLLLALFRKEEDWWKIFGWSLVAGVGLSLYGFAAASAVSGFVGANFHDPGFRFQGSLGNPAYVATYLIFSFAYIFYLFVSKYRMRFKPFCVWALLAVTALFAVVFVLAATRGASLGLIAGVIAFVGYLTFAYRTRWHGLLVKITVGLLAVVLFLIVFQGSAFVQRIPGARLFDISFSANTFRDRVTIWKMAWDGWKARPILGWGPEQFIQVFDRYFNTAYFNPTQGFGSWFDRAHSLIFDYLAETGILGFLSFASIFVVLYVMFFRSARSQIESRTHEAAKKETDHTVRMLTNAIIFSLPFAYIVQGLVLFDILPTYLNVFLFLAFAAYKLTPSLHEA